MQFYGYFTKTVVKYTSVFDCACYSVRGSVYDETFTFDTKYGAILSGSCKMKSWVTHKFVSNTFIFSSSELTKHFKYPMF